MHVTPIADQADFVCMLFTLISCCDRFAAQAGAARNIHMLTVKLDSAVHDWVKMPLDEHRRACSGWRCALRGLSSATSTLQVLQVIGGEEWNTFYSWEPIKRVKTCWKWICVVLSGCPKRRVNSRGVHLTACRSLCVCSLLCHMHWRACVSPLYCYINAVYLFIHLLDIFFSTFTLWGLDTEFEKVIC